MEGRRNGARSRSGHFSPPPVEKDSNKFHNDHCYFDEPRRFGGITGDLAGYFLCLCELMILLTAVIAGRIWP